MRKGESGKATTKIRLNENENKQQLISSFIDSKKIYLKRKIYFALRISKTKCSKDSKGNRSSLKWCENLKSTSYIIFKINVLKLVNKYPKLMKSSVALNFLKTYLKEINETYGEKSTEFRSVKNFLEQS